VSGNLQLLADTLARTRQENRAALITYMTAGFPTVNAGIAAIQAMLNSGADIVEVGLPHSDPVLDGPVIQAAHRGRIRVHLRLIADGSHWRPGGCQYSRQLAGAAYQGDHRTPRLRRNRDFQPCAGCRGGWLR
jgi:hypothetical protein